MSVTFQLFFFRSEVMMKNKIFIKFTISFLLMVQFTLVENSVMKRQPMDYIPNQTPKSTLLVAAIETDSNGNQFQDIFSLLQTLLQIYNERKINGGYIYYTSPESMNNYQTFDQYSEILPENTQYLSPLPLMNDYTINYLSNMNYPNSYEPENMNEFMVSTEPVPIY
ncbi:hypothetical protein MN116_007634 [Schistosoma mekongi]|uniref:Uncharacterized protein n=1 Tax=Schistosoma mekongi TaxID=38744 RepID=A0AAE1Z7T9_SCHME|nr:hypothetical protein MN116_007634 [Schistosoma mekongi]